MFYDCPLLRAVSIRISEIRTVKFSVKSVVILIFLGLLLGLSSIQINYTNNRLKRIKENLKRSKIEIETKNCRSSADINLSRNTGYSENSWLRVTDTIYIYSAYLDRRQRSRKGLVPIRIIGLWRVPPKQELRKDPLAWFHIKDDTLINSTTAYFCKIFYENSSSGHYESVVGESFSRQIFEEGLKTYASTFFNCYLNESLLEKIGESTLAVSVFPADVLDYPAKLVPVKIIGKNAPDDRSDPKTHQLTICIRPFFGPLDNLLDLTQFLFYYESQGVTKFNFYDMGLSPRLKRHLEKVLSLSLNITISLRLWNLPTGNWDELWDYGSLAALNDCVYRNMDTAELIIIVDLDEFMVVQGNSFETTLKDLLISTVRLKSFSQYLVRNTFFCKEFCDFNLSGNEFPIFSCFERTKRIWSSKLRTKYIIRPRDVIQIGHHYVTKFLGDPRQKTTLVFPTDQLLLNHYRECGSISTEHSSVLNRVKIHDYSILKFKNNFQRVQAKN